MADRPDSVVVTGIGVVSPVGIGRESFWSAVCDGASGIGLVERFPFTDPGPRFGAEVKGFEPRAHITSPHLRRMDWVSRMVVASARLALGDAGLVRDSVPAEEIGVVIGSGFGDVSDSAKYLERVFKKGPSLASPFAFPNLVMNAAASYVSMELGATGVNLTVSHGEVSGEQAIALGADTVRQRRARVVLAGGVDELGKVVFDAYRLARALSGQSGGEEWSSPYDADRNGIVLGEGAAVVVLEARAAAETRGARIYAEIADYTSFGIPAPAYDWPVDAAAALARLERMLDSCLAGSTVELVCGSANSSQRLDACELDLFGRLAGASRDGTYLTSLKGAIGEFGAAGALTFAAACLALHEGKVPPLCNLRTPDCAGSLRFAAGRAESARLANALVCGMARGGAGAALCLRRV